MVVKHTNKRNYGGLNFGSKQKITAKTSNYPVTLGESGTLFTTEGGGAVVFTLPTATDGVWYEFFAAEDQTMTVQAGSAIMVLFNNVAATSLAWSTASEKAGQGCRVWSDGLKWFLAEMNHEAITTVIA